MKYFVFDVESAGLFGEGFAVGYAVVDDGDFFVHASDWRTAGIGAVECSESDGDWLRHNLPADVLFPEKPLSLNQLRAWFETELEKFPGCMLASDCAFPVETNWLLACKIQPYPLIDVSTALLVAGKDPVGTYERKPLELPAHHPMHDARQSARVLLECFDITGFKKDTSNRRCHRFESMSENYMDQIYEILFRVRNEVVRAKQKHDPMHSPHEGYAVIQEEVDELWEEIKADEGREGDAMTEAVQIAAMAVRYVLDLQINRNVPPDSGNP